MSLLSKYTPGAISHEEDGPGTRDEMMGQLARGLLERAAVAENKNASRFALCDAEVALDMAEFARDKMRKSGGGTSLPPALLALALARRDTDAPDQLQ